MGHFGREAGAALVFLVAYLALFIWMVYAYFMKMIKWRSRYSMLFFHVTIRVASQACGMVFGIQGFENTDVFLAYLILGAEGYFTLVLCTFRFLISWHQHNLPTHESWLEPRQIDVSAAARWKRFFIFLVGGPLALIYYWREPAVAVHSLLILANTAIIVGGSYLAGADFSDQNSPDTVRRFKVAKIARTSGQSVFLAVNFLLIGTILSTVLGEKKRGAKKTHATLVLFIIVWFPLITRGIFGVLQSAIWTLSYYNSENYISTGFTPRFVAIEYILGVLTEWVSCLLLLLTFYTSRNDPSKGDIAELEKKKEQALSMSSDNSA